MVKPRLYAEDDREGRADLAATLRHVLRETLLLAHPIIPFVTEEVWSHLPGVGDLLMSRRWPGYDATAPLVARLARLELSPDGGDPAAAIVVPGGTVEILAGGAGFDPAEAARKLAEQRAHLEAEVERAEGKLANQGFVAKAPEAVVAAEREKLERLRAELAEL
jgi:valyl-tRNA synthetase